MIDILSNETFLALLAINMIAAIGMNLVYVTGQLNLGQAGFFAIGAYTTAVLSKTLGWPLPVVLAAGALVAAAVALPVALGANRVRGIYLIMGTLAVGELVRIGIGNIDSIGGIQGYTGYTAGGVSLPAVLVTLGLVLATATAVMASPLGLRMRSIFDDEDAAAAAGVATRNVKVVSVVMSGSVVAIAGGLYAMVLLFIVPRDFGIDVSFEIALFTLIGGAHSLAGAFVGAFGITYLLEVMRKIDDVTWVPEQFAFVSPWRFVVYGALVMVIMAVRPEGLVSRRTSLRFLAPFHAVRRRFVRTQVPDRSSPQDAPPTETSPLLSLTGITHRFGGVEALLDVAFDVHRGETVALIGANGAGKTTLINLISGSLASQQGSIRLAGVDLAQLRADRRTKAGVSRTFQSVRMFSHLTVEETLRLGQLAAQNRTAPSIEALLELTTLGGKAGRLSESLTLAEQRRLEIGRAAATAPEIVFLDEPSVGMNSDERTELADLVRSLHDWGVTVVVVDHNLDLALGVADRVVVLDFGRVIAESNPADVFDDPRVREAYLGRAAVVPGAGEGES